VYFGNTSLPRIDKLVMSNLSFTQDEVVEAYRNARAAAFAPAAARVAAVATGCGTPGHLLSPRCSYNGRCTASGCDCDSGWKGEYCHALDLLPASNGSGLNQLHGPPFISTWGGSVVYDHSSSLYHMYSSEITKHCGIHRWVTNSIVVHATSKGPADGWKFQRQGEVKGLFSHEPIVARAPTGEFVVFLTHFDGDAADCPVCNCTDGSSISGEAGCNNECGGGKNKTLFSFFTYSKDPAGRNPPWSKLSSLCAAQEGGWLNCSNPHSNPHIDMNLAPVILSNGSVVAWTRWDIWKAENWNDTSSYRDTGQAPDFNSNPPTPWEGEDPSMWLDKEGHFHALSHNGARGQIFPANQSGDCGRHYFSEDGAAGTWRVAPFAAQDLGGCTYPRVNVPFTDGKNYTFYRRERPHLVLGPDGFTPVGLTTGVIDSPLGPGVAGFGGNQRDASYTLLQPIRVRSRNE